MAEDARNLCVNCAWRANCAKRFSMSGNITLHCPDYCEDIALRNARNLKAEPDVDED